MDKITTGVVAGGIIGAVGVGLAMNDAKTRKRIAEQTRKVMRKDGNNF